MHCRGCPARRAAARTSSTFSGRDIFGEDAAHTTALVVDFQHDLRCRLDIVTEIFLQHQNNKLHWREIVVEHHDLIELGRLNRQFFMLGRTAAPAHLPMGRMA